MLQVARAALKHACTRVPPLQAIVYVQFTWKDPRAVAAIEKFSKLQNDPSECTHGLLLPTAKGGRCSRRIPAAHTAANKTLNNPANTRTGYNQNRGCLRYCDNSFDRDWGRFAGPDGTSR